MFRVVDALISRQLKRLITKEGGSCASMKVANGSVELRDVLFSCPALEETLERDLGAQLPVHLDMVYCRSLSVLLPWAKKDGVKDGLFEVSVEDCSIVLRRCNFADVSAEHLREIKEERIRAQMKGLLDEAAGGEAAAEEKSDDTDKIEKKQGRKERLMWLAVKKVLSRFHPKINLVRGPMRAATLSMPCVCLPPPRSRPLPAH